MNTKHKKRIFSKATGEPNNKPLKRHRKEIHGKSISYSFIMSKLLIKNKAISRGIKRSKNIVPNSVLTNDFEALLDSTTDKYAKVWEALA